MDDDQLKEIFRRASELSASVPEHLQEAAFHRAVDALLGGTASAGKGGSAKGIRAAPAKTQKQEKYTDETDETVQQLLQQIDRTAYPQIKEATRALDRALLVLYAANKDGGVDGLTVIDVVQILKEKFRLPNSQANYDAIRLALDRAGDKVDRVNRSGKVYYRLMSPGEEYVDKLGTSQAKQGADDSSALPSPASKRSRKAPGGGKAKESYSLDRDLNLRGTGNVPSFKDFYESKKPKSKAEFNAVAVYYLQRMLGLDMVSLDQVFTCYKEVGERPAEHFKQSFIDARSKFGYVDFDKDWNVSIPHRGQNFVDHDLPAKSKTKKE